MLSVEADAFLRLQLCTDPDIADGPELGVKSVAKHLMTVLLPFVEAVKWLAGEPITTKDLMSGVIALNIVQVLYIFPLENPAVYATPGYDIQ
ncbi:MAG: hypothetical protein KGS09_14840 [Nitrospirae bacterium]|nr:hypothetical protein [Nitrospirota bacterium]MBU6481813.1 hypothetical protein [Nitrospirota bacterium]